MSKVWIATETYPESTVCLVGETEDAIVREIVRFIGREEYEGFAKSLNGVEATTVTYDDDPHDVLTVWAGARQVLDSTGDRVTYCYGEDWLVFEAAVAK